MNDSAQKFRLSELTAPAFAAALGQNPVVLLTLGSQEDHGPHQPMGDYQLADMVAEQIAAHASAQGTPAYLAPTLPYGVADYFGASPGGLALAPESFRRVLQDVLDGLLRHNLNKIIILNAHGGNVPVIHEVTLGIKRAGGPIIPSFYLWKIARQLMESRIGTGGRFGHGAEPLLSLNLALRRDCVVAAAPPPVPPGTLLGLPVSSFGTLDFHGLAVEAPVEFGDTPHNAIAAAWKLGSAALGLEVAEALVQAGADFVAHFATHAGP